MESVAIRPPRRQCNTAALNQVPNVLADDYIFNQAFYSLNQDTAHLIYSRIFKIGSPAIKEYISFLKHEHHLLPKQRTTQYLNIDSVLAFPTSLPFAKKGLQITFALAHSPKS